MGLVGGLVEWTQAVLGPYGVWGLVLLAFSESVINPVPPDPLLAVLAVDQPYLYALFLGLVAAAASVAGAALGYWIGDRFSPWVHDRFGGERMDQVETWYRSHGEWIVFLAAFTPIPFKVFTLTSGVMRLRFVPFLIAAAGGRTLRFVPGALLAARYGEEVIAWLDRGGLAVLVLVGLAVAGWWLWKRRQAAPGQA